MRGAGGTPGGIGTFVTGLAMLVAGGFLLLNQVAVTTAFWRLWGYDVSGLALVPLLVGVGVLFFNGRSPLGWLLLVTGAIILVAGLLTHMRFFFQPTTLFNTLLMLGLMAGGVGLIARSLREYPVTGRPSS
jgi:hypothetical protein